MHLTVLKEEHITAEISWWSLTQLLTGRRAACVRSVVGWESATLRILRTRCAALALSSYNGELAKGLTFNFDEAEL